jgi:hypothetical protein
MDKTIIGVYDDAAHAVSAKHELLASGFSRRHVQLNPDPDQSTPSEGARIAQHESAVSASIGGFFRSFFFGVGDKSTDSHLYAEAVRRGNSVLIVETASDEECTRAEEIVKRYAPVNMEERSEDWVRRGWRGHDPQAHR